MRLLFLLLVRASGMTTAEQLSVQQQVHSCIHHLPNLDQGVFLSNCPIIGYPLVLQGQELIRVSCCELFSGDLQVLEVYSAFDVTFAGFYDVRCGSSCLHDDGRRRKVFASANSIVTCVV